MKDHPSKLIFTFEWHSLFRDLLRNFWLIVMAGVMLLMLLYVGERSVYSPTYTSSATLVVRAKSGTAGTYTNLSVSADMAKIYAAVFQQPSLKALAAENLGREGFDGEVETGYIEGINLMTVSVTAGDPELAYHLLSSILDVYPQVSEAVFSNAVIDVMIAPQMPTSPGNRISTTRRGALTLAVVLAQALLIALLSLLRETVKHEKAFEKLVEGKLLGTVTHEKPHAPLKRRILGRKSALLIDSAFASLRFSEDYEKLATKLEYLKKNQEAAVVAITSVKENEGKSTAAVNLALSLSERGYRVLLLDLDRWKPSLSKILSDRQAESSDWDGPLAELLASVNCEVLRYRHGSLLLARQRDTAGEDGAQTSAALVRACRQAVGGDVDFLLMDTPPASVSADAAGLCSLADRAILVVRTDRAAAAEINDTIMTLGNVGGVLAGCILNDVYKPFTFFGQMGMDESGAYRRLSGMGKRYGRYGHWAAAHSAAEGEPRRSVDADQEMDGLGL